MTSPFMSSSYYQDDDLEAVVLVTAQCRRAWSRRLRVIRVECLHLLNAGLGDGLAKAIPTETYQWIRASKQERKPREERST